MALATVTKSSWAVFITIVRTTYVHEPTDISTRVIMGRAACHIRSMNRARNPSGGGTLYIPPGGKTLTPKAESTRYVSRMRRIPAHHAGRALDVAEKRDAMRSTLDPTLVASFTPKNSPSTAVMDEAVVARSMVLGRRSAIREVILLLPSAVFRVLASPRSSMMTRPIICGSRKYHALFRS